MQNKEANDEQFEKAFRFAVKRYWGLIADLVKPNHLIVKSWEEAISL